VWHYLRDPTFSRFDTIPEFDTHTHTHTHTQTVSHTTTAYTALYRAVKIDHIARSSIITRQRASVDSKLLYADQEMLVTTTYLNDNARTPLNRFVVYMLYSQLCNKYSDKSNRWSLSLSV